MLYDISVPVDTTLAVWPGDQPFQRQTALHINVADPATASAIHTTLHVGTHADAFSHITPNGAPIDQIPLETYLGPCQVIRVNVARATAIRPPDLTDPIRAPRVLLATGTAPDRTRFKDDFAAMSVELVDTLHAAHVRLVGIDTPGVDLYSAQDLPVHRKLAQYQIATLEGLRLDHVPAGEYELIALPLRLVGCDASPIRAVLRALT